MEIAVLREENYQDVLARAEAALRARGIVIAPTDTVYGIIGDARSASVIRNMFALKRRPEEKAFPVFVRDLAMAQEFAEIPAAMAKLLEKVWPGPVTAIFRHRGNLPEVLTGGLATVGIRVPNHRFLLELLARLNFPLAETSANISGKPPAKNMREVAEYFGEGEVRPNLVINGGELSGQPSTVIDFSGETPVILRAGVLSKRELDRLLAAP